MPAPDTAPTIRSATKADAPALGRLGALLVKTHHDFDTARFMPPSSQTALRYGAFLQSQLDEPDVILLVAVMDAEVVGYTYSAVEGSDYMSLRGPAGVLHDIVVDPSHRGRGVGQLLLERTIAALEERRVPQIVLHTASLNEAAKRLFARAGFRQTMVEMTRDSPTRSD